MSDRVVHIRGADGEETSTLTAKGPAEATPGVSHKGLKIGLCSFLCLLSVAFLIVGAVLPQIVEDTIETKVLETVRIDPQKMEWDSYARWQNATTPMDFHIYRVTNLRRVLLQGDEQLNFQEVEPIKTIRYQWKYNISWNLDAGLVSYKQLTTFEVLPESQHLLDQSIVTVNPFYLGAAAQTMQGYLQKLHPQGKLTVDFSGTGGYLQEKLLTGLLLGNIMTGTDKDPGVLKQFTLQNSTLVMQMRGVGLAFYLNLASGTCTQLEASGDAALADCWNKAKGAWATATPFLSAVPLPEALFTGFELNATLTHSDPKSVADQLFDPANQRGLASIAGLGLWGRAGSGDPAAVADIMTNFGLALADLQTVGAWVASLTTTDPDPANPAAVGSAYERAVCLAVEQALKQIDANPGATVWQSLYGGDKLASYTPKSWLDLAALQWGSGAVVAIGLQSAQYGGMGIGSSFAALAGPGNVDKSMPFHFDNLASGTFGGAEPMEFVAGIQYALENLAPTYNPATALHLSSPALAGLIYANEATSTPIPLSIAQARQLLDVLTAAPDRYLMLTLGVTALVQTYAGQIQGGANTTVARGAVKATLDAFASGALPEDCPDETQAKQAGELVAAAGITEDNFYAVFTFLYSYLGNELTGSLSALDADGVAPQNSGLFTRRTIRQILFDSEFRFPGQIIPGIAGIERHSKPFEQLLDEDYIKRNGREIVQYTGHGQTLSKLGAFHRYDGVHSYSHNCDLVDPFRVDICEGDEKEAVNDYPILGAKEVIDGNGDGTTSAPFREDEEDLLREMSLYVDEASRSLPLLYTGPQVIKRIDVRRYEVNPAVLVAGDGSEPNPHKNEEKYHQSPRQAPDGFYSIQRVSGGVPLLLSKPRWNFAGSSFNGGVTCSEVGSTDRAPCPSTYSPDAHNTWVDIEPITGLTLRGAKRLQANARVSAFEFYTGPASCPNSGTTCAPQCSAATPAAGSFPDYWGSPLQGTASGGFNGHYNKLFAGTAGGQDAFRETLILPYYWGDQHDEVKDGDAQKLLDAKDDMAAGRKLGRDVQIAGVVVGSVGFVATAAAIIWLAIQPRKPKAPAMGVN